MRRQNGGLYRKHRRRPRNSKQTLRDCRSNRKSAPVFRWRYVVFAALGLVAGGTVPLVLKCTKRLYTVDLIGVGASVNTTAAGIFAGASQPIIGLAMVGVSQLAGTDVEHGPSS